DSGLARDSGFGGIDASESGVALDGSDDATDASPDPHRVVSISVGVNATACALTLDGLVYCWGANSEGEVGDGTRLDRAQAVRVQSDSTGDPFANIVEVSVGGSHVCARDLYRYFYCWG